MSRALTKPTPAATVRREVARAKDYASQARAPNTRRAYRGHWKRFEAWCKRRRIDPATATAEHVATYLAALADAKKKASTIDQALAAISFAMRLAKNERYDRRSSVLIEVRRGIRRSIGTAVTKKSPMTTDVLRDVLDEVDGTRDRALLLLGFAGAFRRSELAALTLDDVTFCKEGMRVRVARSKTDQSGEGQEKAIPFARDEELCAVTAMRLWIGDGRPSDDARVFCISSEAIRRIVKKYVEAAGYDPADFSGHSLRAGFATSAAEAGKPLESIMAQTGHRSIGILLGYIRRVDAFKKNAMEGLL